jgi:Dockerin type I domain
MKRSLFLFLILLGITLLSRTSFVEVHASDGSCILRVVPETQTVQPGHVCTVNITFEDLPSKESGVVGCNFASYWDSSILEATSIQEVAFHSATPEDEWINIFSLHMEIDNTLGRAVYAVVWQDVPRAIAVGYAPLTGNGTWMTITFRGKQIGTSSVSFSSGWLQIIATNPSRYLFVFPANGQIEQQTIQCDINRDGTVDIYDTVLLARLFSTEPSDPKWNPAADINSDGIVDIYDAMTLAETFGWQFPGS